MRAPRRWAAGIFFLLPFAMCLAVLQSFAGDSPPGEGVSLSVSVIDTAGKPAVGCYTLRPQGSGEVSAGETKVEGTGIRSAPGKKVFVFRTATNGDAGIASPWEECVLPPIGGNQGSSDFWAIRAAIDLQKDTELTLWRGGGISITGAVQHVDGSPEPDCLVAFFQPRSAEANGAILRMEGTFTDRQGRFRLGAPFPPGPVEIRVLPKDYPTTRLTGQPAHLQAIPEVAALHLDFLVGRSLGSERRPYWAASKDRPFDSSPQT